MHLKIVLRKSLWSKSEQAVFQALQVWIMEVWHNKSHFDRKHMVKVSQDLCFERFFFLIFLKSFQLEKLFTFLFVCFFPSFHFILLFHFLCVSKVLWSSVAHKSLFCLLCLFVCLFCGGEVYWASKIVFFFSFWLFSVKFGCRSRLNLYTLL